MKRKQILKNAKEKNMKIFKNKVKIIATMNTGMIVRKRIEIMEKSKISYKFFTLWVDPVTITDIYQSGGRLIIGEGYSPWKGYRILVFKKNKFKCISEYESIE